MSRIKQTTPAKQIEINQENRSHENTLKALKDRLDEENLRHSDNLSQIPERVARMLAGMAQSLGGRYGGVPAAGNYPQGAPPGSPTNDYAGSPQPGSTGGAPARPGSPQNPLEGYASNQPETPGGASSETTTTGPYSPLFYLNNALNEAVARIPNGSQTLQQAGQAAGRVDRSINRSLNDTARKLRAVRDAMAKEMTDKWTRPMSPQDALGEVGKAWVMGAFGAGVGAAARTGAQGGTFGTALKAAVSVAAQEGKVTAGLGGAANAGVGALASRGSIDENSPKSSPPSGSASNETTGAAPNQPGQAISGSGGTRGGSPPGARPPGGGGDELGGGGPGWRPPPPNLTQEGDILKATWPQHPNAIVEFQRGLGGAIAHNINRGEFPPGSGGALLAAALRQAGITRPRFIQFYDIRNPPTLSQMAAGRPPIDTVLGNTAANAAREFGWQLSGTGVFHPADALHPYSWINFDVSYPP